MTEINRLEDNGSGNNGSGNNGSGKNGSGNNGFGNNGSERLGSEGLSPGKFKELIYNAELPKLDFQESAEFGSRMIKLIDDQTARLVSIKTAIIESESRFTQEQLKDSELMLEQISLRAMAFSSLRQLRKVIDLIEKILFETVTVDSFKVMQGEILDNLTLVISDLYSSSGILKRREVLLKLKFSDLNFSDQNSSDLNSIVTKSAEFEDELKTCINEIYYTRFDKLEPDNRN